MKCPNGLRLPPAAETYAECRVLRAHSRQNSTESKIQLEQWIQQNAPVRHRGQVTGHSLCASYTYTLVTSEYYDFAVQRQKMGLLQMRYEALSEAARQAVYDADL